MAKTKYFKLGEKASTFHDPKSGLHIVNDQVVAIKGAKTRHSKQLKAAIEGGHIKEVNEAEFTSYKNRHAKEEKALEKAAEKEKARAAKRKAKSKTEAKVESKAEAKAKKETKEDKE